MTAPTYRLTERVSAREVEGELILLDLDDGDFFVARGTSPRIWELIADGSAIDDVIEQVCARYPDVPSDDVRRDVGAFVEDLVSRGFLERIDHQGETTTG